MPTPIEHAAGSVEPAVYPHRIGTLFVTANSRSRLSRLKVRYPDHVSHPEYDAALARELLARTCELPGTRRGLVTLLIEYRHALHALANPRATMSPEV